MNDLPLARRGRNADLFLLANHHGRGHGGRFDLRHRRLRLSQRRLGRRIDRRRKVDARFRLRRTGRLGRQCAVHSQPEGESGDNRDREAARNATTQLAERLGFGRRLTSSVSQGSRSKSRAIVSPIGSAHLLGGSHAHEGEATAYDLPNA